MCQRWLKSAHERGVILRRNVSTTIKIVSGGQTGVDQGALEAAARLGMEFGGWAPARWLAEKPLGAIPEAYRAAMREYPDQGSNAQNYRERAIGWATAIGLQDVDGLKLSK